MAYRAFRHRGIEKVQAESTGAAADVEIIPADANSRIRVTKLIFTSTVATTLTLKRGSTEIMKFLDIGATAIDDLEALKTDINENFNYTTGAGNSEVYAEFFTS